MAMAPVAAPGGGGPPPGMDMAAALGGGAGADPGAGADAAPDTDDNVILTVCDDGQGGFLIYTGDEPEAGEGDDGSEAGADAMGPGGDEPANPPQTAGSMGEALKIIMDILKQKGEGGPGGAQAAFDQGFTGSQAPTPAGGGGPGGLQKFPGGP